MSPPGGAAATMTVRGLRVRFGSGDGSVTPVDGVDFDLGAGEVLGIAGESGSGKSLTLRAVIGLQPRGAEVSGDLRLSAGSWTAGAV